MPVQLSELEDALEYSSIDYSFGCYSAYVNLETGELIHYSDEIDAPEAEIPDDIDDSKKYVQVPTKKDLDLGKPLVIRFATETIPEELDRVHGIFSRRGAYQRFKVLLSSIDKLDAWYQFEAAEQKLALIKWCKDNDIEFGE